MIGIGSHPTYLMQAFIVIYEKQTAAGIELMFICLLKKYRWWDCMRIVPVQ